MAPLDAYRRYWEGKISSSDIEQFFSSFDSFKSRRSIRVNTLKTSRDFMQNWLVSQGYSVQITPESPDGLEITGTGEPLALKVPYYCGYTYPQDAASMFAVEVLNPQPGETCIDLTAAPGGKSTHIAQKMHNTGVLFSNDMDTKRIKALRSNLERLGVWNTVVTRARPYDLSLWYPEMFDAVLADPSCSGEGLFCTPGGQPEFWKEKNLKAYARDQYSVLASAFRLLKPGGRLVYSTCTLNLEEDDGVVQRLLEAYPEAELLPIEISGIPEQIGDFLGVRFWPHKTKTKGFFCALIGKRASLGLHSEHARPFERLKPASRLLMQALESELAPFHVTSADAWPHLDAVEFDEHVFMIAPELARAELPSRFNLTHPVLEYIGTTWRLTDVARFHIAAAMRDPVIALQPQEALDLFDQKFLSGKTCSSSDVFGLRYFDFPLGVGRCKHGAVDFRLVDFA